MRFGRSPFALVALTVTLGLSSASARAADDASATVAPAPQRGPSFPNGGDFGAYLLERYGGLVLPGALHGESGPVAGSGFEARYLLPVGWGAYAHWTHVVQQNVTCGADCWVWDQWEATLGLSRRLQATPQNKLIREHTRFDLGFAYSQAGTNLSCGGAYVPWNVACASGSWPSHPINSSGSAVGMEARLALEIGIGPVGLGFDFGGAAYKSLTHGSASDPLPSLFYAWSAQARAGVNWTIE